MSARNVASVSAERSRPTGPAATEAPLQLHLTGDCVRTSLVHDQENKSRCLAPYLE